MSSIKRLPILCPGCDSALRIKRMHCVHCETEVSGSFALPLLARLPDKDQTFVLDFIKSSGSLKDMAKNMGLSYPTVRNRLDELIEAVRAMENEEKEQ